VRPRSKNILSSQKNPQMFLLWVPGSQKSQLPPDKKSILSLFLNLLKFRSWNQGSLKKRKKAQLSSPHKAYLEQVKKLSQAVLCSKALSLLHHCLDKQDLHLKILCLLSQVSSNLLHYLDQIEPIKNLSLEAVNQQGPCLARKTLKALNLKNQVSLHLDSSQARQSPLRYLGKANLLSLHRYLGQPSRLGLYLAKKKKPLHCSKQLSPVGLCSVKKSQKAPQYLEQQRLCLPKENQILIHCLEQLNPINNLHRYLEPLSRASLCLVKKSQKRPHCLEELSQMSRNPLHQLSFNNQLNRVSLSLCLAKANQNPPHKLSLNLYLP